MYYFELRCNSMIKSLPSYHACRSLVFKKCQEGIKIVFISKQKLINYLLGLATYVIRMEQNTKKQLLLKFESVHTIQL